MGDDTTHTITSLTNGTDYTVQVRATSAAGNGAWAEVSDTPLGTLGAVPAAPALAADGITAATSS